MNNGHPQPKPTHDDEANLVPCQDACPRCGERHVDHLVWIEDDIVRCTTCGIEYDPSNPPLQGGSHVQP